MRSGLKAVEDAPRSGVEAKRRALNAAKQGAFISTEPTDLKRDFDVHLSAVRGVQIPAERCARLQRRASAFMAASVVPETLLSLAMVPSALKL